MSAGKPPAALAAAAFLVCVLIWGSTWLAIKVGYEGVGPFLAAAMRFGLASLILLVLARWQGHAVRLRGPHLRLAVFAGVVMFVGDYGLIYWGEQFLPSGLTAVLFATMPFSTAALAQALLPDEPVTRRKLAGAALGIAGLAVVFRESVVVDPALALPMLAILLSAVCASATGVAAKRWGHDLHPVSLFAVAMGVGAVGLLPLAVLDGERLALPGTALAWVSVLYLVVLGSVVAFLLYFWLLKTHDATKLSLVTVLTPLVALALGAALLGEALGALELAGVGLVLLGVWLAVSAGRARAPAPEAPLPATSPGAGAK